MRELDPHGACTMLERVLQKLGEDESECCRAIARKRDWLERRSNVTARADALNDRCS